SAAIDTGPRSNIGTRAEADLLLTAPRLNATQLPNGKTMSYTIIHSDNADLSSPSNLAGSGLIVQTGVGSAGAAGDSKRIGLPSDHKQYLGFTVTGSASGDASDVSATLEWLF